MKTAMFVYNIDYFYSKLKNGLCETYRYQTRGFFVEDSFSFD